MVSIMDQSNIMDRNHLTHKKLRTTTLIPFRRNVTSHIIHTVRIFLSPHSVTNFSVIRCQDLFYVIHKQKKEEFVNKNICMCMCVNVYIQVYNSILFEQKTFILNGGLYPNLLYQDSTLTFVLYGVCGEL